MELENRCTPLAYRGFESHPLRHARTWNREPSGATFLVLVPRRGARVDDWARLESVCTFGYRGFESHPLRQNHR